MPRRCFVISPIGDPGSEVRDHADDVFEFIIKPATDRLGMFVTRADQDLRVGRISDQMFESILSADLCVTVLNGQNPNVFYELAIAQSAARPVIILNLKGHPLPFDVKDLRVIEYTLRPRMIRDQVYVQQIVDMANDLDKTRWEVAVPFGPDLVPLRRKKEAGSFAYRERSEDFANSQEWLRLFERAERGLDFSGRDLRYWTRMTDFVSLIERKARAGVVIRFLLMHPANPALPSYVNRGVTAGLDQMREDLAHSRAVLQDLATSNPGQVEVREMVTCCPRQQIARADDTIWLTLYLHSEPARRSPLFECSHPSPLLPIMYNEFQALWKANPPAVQLLELPAAPPPSETPAGTLTP